MFFGTAQGIMFFLNINQPPPLKFIDKQMFVDVFVLVAVFRGNVPVAIVELI